MHLLQAVRLVRCSSFQPWVGPDFSTQVRKANICWQPMLCRSS